MKQQPSTQKLYWKDALREVKVELNSEVSSTQQHNWAQAYRQAQADLAAPGAIVWLPDEIAVVIQNRTEDEPISASAPHRSRRILTAMILGIALLVPIAAFSFFRAYRQIAVTLR
jgi:hypothetical protein